MIDTQLALWTVQDNPKLGSRGKQRIGEAGIDVVVSVVSLWEIGIKYPLRHRYPDPILLNATDALEEFVAAKFEMLPVTPAHALSVDRLPPLHGDPFDRLLVAQAMAERVPFLTRDRHLRDYSDLVELV